MLRRNADRLRKVLAGPIARGASTALILRSINVVLGFASTLLLAKVLGADGFGVFVYGSSIAILISLPSRLGLQLFLVRMLPGFESRKDGAGFTSACVFAFTSGIGASTICSLVTMIIILAATGPSEMRTASLIGTGIAPLISVVCLAQSFLRARMKIVRAFTPEFVIVQAIFLASIALAAFEDVATPIVILCCFGAAWTLTAMVAVFWVLHAFPSEMKNKSAAIKWRSWSSMIVAMTVAGLFALLVGRLEPVVLAAFSTPAEAGVYTLALRFALLATFPGFAISSGLGPVLARLHAEGDGNAIRHRLALSARAGVMGVLAASFGVIILTFGVLPFFGADFAHAQSVVLILLAGFVMQAMNGRAYETLNMLGHLRQAVFVGLGAIVAYVALIFALTPAYGAVGAAMATAIAITLHSAALAFFAWKQTGLRCDIFGVFQPSQT